MSKQPFACYMVALEIGGNAKVGRLTDRQFRCLISGVWPLAGKSERRGYLIVAGQPANAADVAHQARCSESIARSTLEKMRELRMLEPPDETGFEYCHDWHTLNPDPRPSESAEARRERKRRSRNGHADVTRDNGSMSRGCHTPEVEGEVELPSAKASGSARKRANRRVDQTVPPPDFPADLTGALTTSLDLLHGAWEVRGGNIEPQPRGVGLSMLRNAKADHVSVARKLQHWLLAGKGQRASTDDIAARFGDWLENEGAAQVRFIPADGTAGRRPNASDLLREINQAQAARAAS